MQNIVITIDKVRMCLKQDCQPKGPPLVPLTQAETLQHLWTGDKSIINKFFKAFLKLSMPGEMKKFRGDALTKSDIAKLAARAEQKHPVIAQICNALRRDVQDIQTARTAILHIESLLRSMRKPSSKIF